MVHFTAYNGEYKIDDVDEHLHVLISKNGERLATTTTTSRRLPLENCDYNDANFLRRDIQFLRKFKRDPKSKAFNNKHTLHDPSINNVVVSCSTLKYALIVLTALGLLASFIYLLVIGVLNQHTCVDTGADETSLSTYLIVMGCVGCLRLLTFFSCPFDYSKSILSKTYEHLVWRLVVNRFKTAYHGAVARLKTRVWEQDESASASRRAYFRLACLGGFLYQFVCCGFDCCSCFVFNCRPQEEEIVQDDEVGNDVECGKVRSNPAIKQTPEVSFSLWENKEKPDVITTSPKQQTKQQVFNDSTSNLSGLTETTLSSRGIILNELNCFKNPFDRVNSTDKTTPNQTNQQNKVTTHVVKIPRTMSIPMRQGTRRNKRSRSASELRDSPTSSCSFTQQSKNSSVSGGGGGGGGGGRSVGVSGSNNKRVKFTSSIETAQTRRAVMPTYGNQYFSGKYDSKYGTHKHLRRHHNKTQRPISLFDFNSIRYGVFYLLQRALDVFIIVWFICGNYWVFNTDLNTLFDVKNLTNTTNSTMNMISSGANTNKLKHNTRQVLFDFMLNSNDSTRATLKTSLICYHTAYIHIIVVYAFICLIVFVAISYQIYSFVNSLSFGKQNGDNEVKSHHHVNNNPSRKRSTMNQHRRSLDSLSNNSNPSQMNIRKNLS